MERAAMGGKKNRNSFGHVPKNKIPNTDFFF